MDDDEANQVKQKHIQTLKETFAARQNFLVYGESVFVVAWMISYGQWGHARHEITLSNGGMLVINEEIDYL